MSGIKSTAYVKFSRGVLLCFLLCVAPVFSQDKKIEFIQHDDQIDVFGDGQLFTSYRYSAAFTKPILFPIHSPSGIIVNRMYPIEKVPGETEDHPHHTGLFFTSDEVNGTGFWNAVSPPPQIVHTGVTHMAVESGQGILSVESLWNDKDNQTLLKEQRTMTFCPGDSESTIDFDIRLTAVDQTVVFNDTKEGMFAIRVAEWLKEDGGTGHYLSSNGDETEKGVWGKRARWVALEGEKERRRIGIVICHHPGSVNYPTYWHARAYGLFSANPLGSSVFESSLGKTGAVPFRYTLKPGETGSFKFRVVVYEGAKNKDHIEQLMTNYK